MDVCISLQGETFIVKLVTDYNIKQLKQSIHKLIEVQPRHQLLVFNGKKL